jgi:hypothetical protein
MADGRAPYRSAAGAEAVAEAQGRNFDLRLGRSREHEGRVVARAHQHVSTRWIAANVVNAFRVSAKPNEKIG